MSTSHVGRRALLAGLLSLLVACATRPVPDAERPWTSGRITLNVEAASDRPAQRMTADFDLRGDALRGELQISSTVGTRLATLAWSRDGAWLDSGTGPVRYRDLDDLSRAALGESLPLQALPDWVAGRPWTGAPSEAAAEGFVQLGWRVTVAAAGQGRIEALRETPPRVHVLLRVQEPAR